MKLTGTAAIDAESLTGEMIAECEEIGTAWGEQEVEAFRDQNDGRMPPEWTLGTYCGPLPGGVPMNGSALAIALENAIDRAAREVWNAAKDARC